MNIKNVYKISKKEFFSNIRNYWFIFSAIIFCLFNFIIIYFGDIMSGDYSQTDIRSLSLSIIHLQMYIIPLLSFVLSYDAILSEKELGTLDLFLTYRVSFFDIFLGKLFGNGFIFSMSFLIGFMPVAFYLYILGINFIILFKFIIISMWLSFIFNSFALFTSNFSNDRTVVILLSIFIWLFFVFIYDLLFTFLIVFFYGTFSNDFFSFFLLFNPAELFRLISIFYFMPSSVNEFFGIDLLFFNNFYIIISMFLWSFFILLFGFLKYK